MTDSIEFRSAITRARGNSRFIEIELLDKTYKLHRDNAADLAILANLARERRFGCRSKMRAHELCDMMTHGELWLDIEGDPDIAWIAPVDLEPITPGPHALNLASMAFFGRPFRTRVGRSPRAMAECRGAACEDCGAAADHAHHLVPRAMGGEDVDENLVPLCADCHRKRHRECGAIALRPGRYRVEVISFELPSLLEAVSAIPGRAVVRIAPSWRQYSVQWPIDIMNPIVGMWDLHLGREGRRLVVRCAERAAA